MTADPAVDAGFAVERTALAWRRTAFSAMAVVVLMLAHTIDSGWRDAGVIPLAAAGAMSVIAIVGYARSFGLQAGHRHAAPQLIAVTAVVVMIVGVAAILTVLLHPR